MLYFQSDWNLASSPAIAVVGTRNPTQEGRSRAAKLVKLLVKDGFIPTCNQTVLRLIASWYGGEQSPPASF
jgi:hypothetical protein